MVGQSLLIDYHVHTDNSFDCKIPMIDMCQRAVMVGISEIAFTDHFNNNLLDIDLGYYEPQRYFDDIEFCRARFPQLTILAGVELGEPHLWEKRIQPILERYPYDIVLGSVHRVGKESLFDPNYYRSRSPDEAYRLYFEEVLRMIDRGGFDVLAHVDLPKRMTCQLYGEFDSYAYEDLFRAVWQACIDHQIVPEINTKGLRTPAHQLHPTTEALQWYVEMGGKNITIGSDSHHSDSLSGDLHTAQQSALDAGLTHNCRFFKRRITGWHQLAG